MGKFFGTIIGTILSRLIVMGAIVAGGQYYLQQSGGIAGLLGGDGTSPMSDSPPISAGIGGLGAIASTWGIGTPSKPDYFEVQGRISDIRMECRLVRDNDGKQMRTEPLSCERARTALTYPQFAEYTLSKGYTASYIYYDMDGVKVLSGKAMIRSGHRVGDVIDLRVDSDNPRKSTPI